MNVSRQTHLVAAAILALSIALGSTVATTWFYLALLPTCGLLLDAATGICPMTLILRKMPWNATRTASS